MTTLTIRLPTVDGTTETRTLHPPAAFPTTAAEPSSRIAYAAAHVVADPLGENRPGAPAVIDWEHTLAFRRHLWGLGLGVAEAMDTAQRGMGLDWTATQELIRRSAAEARGCGGRIAVGAGTDHASPTLARLDDVAAAYEEQLEVVQDSGATVILMASRQLASIAKSPDDYASVYSRILRQVQRPVILHWLGEMFDPELAGYWGTADVDSATKLFLELVTAHAAAIDGVKVSLLDAAHETALRRQLPAGVRLYTGDDFNYPQLIAGDEQGHSDALLGVFAAIAPAASAALQALDREDLQAYHAVLDPTVPLARKIFATPTYYYKTGIAFLAWLNGHQPGFTMVGGLQSGRSLPHLVETFRLADEAGLLRDPGLAAHRMTRLLEVYGARP
jgi:Protein of unknown function (DUF993)